ncbi:MAG: hypothetical protein ACE5FK_07530 [Candidatus Methylomirabilia bacterium]
MLRMLVQYGAMSGISLTVLQHLRGLGVEMIPGGEIDRRCLGGSALEMDEVRSVRLDRRYWCGGGANDARLRVGSFLSDLDSCCSEIARVLRRGGVAVFVTARRRVGGWRLYLDRFIVDAFERRKLRLQSSYTRRIAGKLTPAVINRDGHGKVGVSGKRTVATMREEQVLVFRKN